MSHHFYIQNATRRSAQAFPIDLPAGARFAETKDIFAEMLGVPTEQIIRLTTAEGHIVLPGQTVPDEPLLLELERRAFDRLTGAGSFAPMENVWHPETAWNTIFPTLVVLTMFVGFSIILGGLASAANQCSNDHVAAWLFANLFAWGSNTSSAQSSGINLKFICGLSLSLFWFIIFLQFVICILPGIILLFYAGAFSADTKGSWAYIITCTLNIVTALLCFEAYTVVPGAYYAQKADTTAIPGSIVGLAPDSEYEAGIPAKYVQAVQCMAAGVIILLVANFSWIYSQAYGKMIPETFRCCEMMASAPRPPPEVPSSGIVSAKSPITTPTRAPTVISTM